MLNTYFIAPAGLLIATILLIIMIVSTYFPRYRIVKYEKHDNIWYGIQRTFVLWLFWEDMTYAASPYSDFPYKFRTYDEAKDTLDRVKGKNAKPKMTVMK